MAKKKDKKNPALKQAPIDISTYGVNNSTSGSKGTSSTSYVGGYANWSKVDDAKTVMESVLSGVEKSKNRRDTTRLRNQCRRDGGMWDPKTGTCIKDGGTSTNNNEEVAEEVVEEKNEEVVEEVVEEENNEEVEEKDEEVAEEKGEGEEPTKKEEEMFSQEIETGEYEVKTDTKFALANLFKKGKIRQPKYQYDKNTRNRMKAEMNSLRKQAGKLRREKGEDWEKKAAELNKQASDMRKEIYTKKIKVKIPGKGWKSMTIEEFEKNYADKLDLKSKGGRSFGREKGELPSGKFYSESKPIQFRSPFPRRNRGYLNKRKDWLPNEQSPMNHGSFEDFQYGRNGHNPDTMKASHEDWHAKQSSEKPPMNYGSPLHQEEKQSVKGQQFGSIWEKIKAYGPDMPEKIDKFVQHVSYNPETDKPTHALQNQEWVGAITKWLQEQKAAIVKARNNKNQDEQQKIVASVNTLIQDVITYSGKFMAWKDRNSGNQEEGSAGGSVVSEGSRKDERFIGNTTFMGDVNTTIAVGPDGKLGIKAFGLPEVRYVEELDNQVFAKDDVGLLQFTRISEELQRNAQSGQPLNENVVKGNADQLLKSKDSILSWAFDPLYGQSWLQDYVQANPDADIDMFMPESSSFDIDYLTDELHGWLTSKLKESYDKNVPQQPAQKGDAAQGIMNETLANVEEEKKNKQGVYAEGEQQPQQQMMAQEPPQQESPMGYKKSSSERAIELLRKYSK
tara:strand:+ start:5138 stop:7333 length:2196 start_codon:yes stop_codon:yes gene_type:complete